MNYILIFCFRKQHHILTSTNPDILENESSSDPSSSELSSDRSFNHIEANNNAALRAAQHLTLNNGSYMNETDDFGDVVCVEDTETNDIMITTTRNIQNRNDQRLLNIRGVRTRMLLSG